MTNSETESCPQPEAAAPPSMAVQSAEVAVFLFLIVPSLALSLFGGHQGLGFPLTATATIFRDLALVSLILFFLWRNGEPRERIGWTWRHAYRELALGVLCFVPVSLGAAAVERLLLDVGLTTPKTAVPTFLQVQGTAEIILALLLVAVVAVAEETIFRGYLLLRFGAILHGTGRAVLLSSAIFAIGHGYEGSAGLVTVGFLGAAFAVIYVWRKSLIAPMVMHFLQDFLGLVLLPLLGLK